jgi:hypothetical protein
MDGDQIKKIAVMIAPPDGSNGMQVSVGITVLTIIAK